MSKYKAGYVIDDRFIDDFDHRSAKIDDFITLVCSFMSMTTAEVFDRFRTLDGPHTSGRDWLFIPGKADPDKRVLFVAHADTVFAGGVRGKGKGFRPKLSVYGSIIDSGSSKDGIGADDRVGCAMLWALRDTGHSILITDDEEIGCVGARSVSRAIPDVLSEHCYAIEIDRRGDSEFVFYTGTHSTGFEDYLLDHAPFFESGWGSITDIDPICNAAGICGANFAAGYINEHTAYETFFLDAWLRTLDVIYAMVSEVDSLDRFVPDPIPSYKGGWSPTGFGAWGDDDLWADWKLSDSERAEKKWHEDEGDEASCIDDVIDDWEGDSSCLICGDDIEEDEILDRILSGPRASITSGWGSESWVYEMCDYCLVHLNEGDWRINPDVDDGLDDMDVEFSLYPEDDEIEMELDDDLLDDETDNRLEVVH